MEKPGRAKTGALDKLKRRMLFKKTIQNRKDEEAVGDSRPGVEHRKRSSLPVSRPLQIIRREAVGRL